jgi:hypothetical protein
VVRDEWERCVRFRGSPGKGSEICEIGAAQQGNPTLLNSAKQKNPSRSIAVAQNTANFNELTNGQE